MSHSACHAERREVLYSGHVQGVGFRYTVQRIAHHYAVTGYVRNLSDRRVQLVVEGFRDQIDGLLEEIASQMGHHIRSTTQTKLPATGEFVDFRICT